MAKVYKENDNMGVFECPGCGTLHSIHTPQWEFNWNLDSPTVSPSILVYGIDGVHHRCHSFVKDGMIQFLDDCTHELRGQTVEIPDWTSYSEVLNRDDKRC